MYRLTDVDTMEAFPELQEVSSTSTLKNFFFENEESRKDYNGDFTAWLADSVRFGFFEKLA